MLIDTHGWNGLIRGGTGLWHSLRCLESGAVLLETKTAGVQAVGVEVMDETQRRKGF